MEWMHLLIGIWIFIPKASEIFYAPNKYISYLIKEIYANLDLLQKFRLKIEAFFLKSWSILVLRLKIIFRIWVKLQVIPILPNLDSYHILG